MNNLMITTMCDFYKINHREQYPSGTESVYSTWTARSNKHNPELDKVVVFGIYGFIQELHNLFNDRFFKRSKDEVISEYKRMIKYTLGIDDPYSKHWEELHDLGYLPLEFKSLSEGISIPFNVPMMTVENTDPRFFWLTNFIETYASATLWKPSTTATIARKYREILDKYAVETSSVEGFVDFQAHDFSMRGVGGIEDSARSGAGHLLFFKGTDTIPAIKYLEDYYHANIENELVGSSVNATEHSVMCAGGFEHERETYRRLIEDIYPNGILSIVSDTWDLWKVVTEILPSLKTQILSRNGKIVVRPDSGDPVDILCGTISNLESFNSDDYPTETDFLKAAEDYMYDTLVKITPHGECGYDYTCDVVYNNKIYNLTYSPDWHRYDKQYYFIDNDGDKTPTINSVREITASDKGLIEALYDTFGGTRNSKGYIELDEHIGAIYGDSITLKRCNQICEKLKLKGFASTNVVFGIGSYTYQFITRDTLGFAMKATSVRIDGQQKAIFKDPATDSGTKKSHFGKVKIVAENKVFKVLDEKSEQSELEDQLFAVYANGIFLGSEPLHIVRGRADVR